jgi:cytochrome c553
VKTLLAGLLALWSACLFAQGIAEVRAGAEPAWNELKGEKLLALKLKGDPARGADAFEICQGCHKRGATGTVSGAYPRLAGQHATVLIKQIADIRSGRRANPKMKRFAHEEIVEPQDIADIAAYLQTLPIPANFGKGPGTLLSRGKELYARDCASCHGDRGEGNAEKFFPMVAGQHYKYLLREVRFIRDADRGNANPDMIKVVKPYSDADIEAVADYMAALPLP